jgi:hypothetical protein
MDNKKVNNYMDMILKYFTFVSVLNDLKKEDSTIPEGSARVIESEPLLLQGVTNEKS